MTSEIIISVLRKHSGEEQIRDSYSIVDDLGIDGDDADDMYFDLLDNHGIDLKKLAIIGQCFHTESELLDLFYFPKWLLCKLGLRNKPPRRALKPLLVSDLLSFAKKHSEA